MIQYFLGVLAASLPLIIVFEMLRKNRLRERHAFWWLLLGTGALLISLFPDSLQWISRTLGFEVPVNLVFFISLFVLFLVALQHSSELTEIENHNRAVVERLVLLESSIRQSQPTETNGEK